MLLEKGDPDNALGVQGSLPGLMQVKGSDLGRAFPEKLDLDNVLLLKSSLDDLLKIRPDAGHPLLLTSGQTPFVIYRGQQARGRSGWFSPAVENLTWEDLVILVIFGWALVQVVLRLVTVPSDDRRRRGIPVGRTARRVILWAVHVGAVVLICLIAVHGGSGIDARTDWPAIVKNASPGDSFVMTLVPYRPYQEQSWEMLMGPSRAHWLGTDQMGRDVLAQLIHGAKVSLAVGFVAVSIAVVIGTFFGALGGYFGGRVDFWVMRLIEVMMCFPPIFLILTVSVIVKERSVWTVMAIIGVTGWTGAARLIRGEFFKQRAMEYVTAAQAVGNVPSRIMFLHILPNAMAPVLVSATFGIAGAIITESTLSFLNLGVPPDVASWGRTLSYGLQYVRYAWWLVMFPGLAIFLTVTAYNLAGEGLRDAVDPRMRI
jgi:peptide/nickel transport system permease protein